MSKDPLYKFEKILEKKRLKELEPEKLISPVRRPRVRRPVTASASVDTRCRRRKNGSARNVSGNPSVFSAPAAVWDDPRGRRPSTAGADFIGHEFDQRDVAGRPPQPTTTVRCDVVREKAALEALEKAVLSYALGEHL